MHDLLKSQLQSLGLDDHTPPTADQWQRFLNHLSLNFLDEQLHRYDQDLEQQLEEAMLLNRVMVAVNSSSETNDVLTVVCRELAQTLDMTYVTCALLSWDRSELIIAAEYFNNPSKGSLVGSVLPIVDQSITQDLLKNRGPVFSSDIQNDERFAAASLLPENDRETVASMLVPLLIKGRVIGIVALNHHQTRQFSKREITVAQNVAASSGQALENAQLVEELQAKYKEQSKSERLLRHQNMYLAALHETMLGLMQRLDLSILLEDIVEYAASLLGTRHGFLYVVDPSTQYPIMRAGLGIFRHGIGSLMSGPESLAGRVWVKQQTVLSNQPEDLLLNGSHLGKIFAWIGLPLFSAGQVTGLIGLVHLQEGQTFSTEQMELLERFAQLASLGIDNAKLYSAAQNEIAERQIAEQHLEEAKKMAESASRAKSTFLARMSHELRTPLTAIIGYSDIMQEELKELNQEYLLEDMRYIRRSAQILLELINDILDLSKIESGEVTMYFQDFHVADLIKEVVSVSRPLLKKNNNHLEIHLSPNLGAMNTDLVKLRQVLLNLISNAAKFTENGIISVFGRRCVDEELETVEIDISDTGIGISSHQQEAIFEPFIQADDSDTRKFGGTGLGLAISRRFCRMMGGDIYLESKPDQGSIFTIRLPSQPPLVIRNEISTAWIDA